MLVGQGAQRRKLVATLPVQMNRQQCPGAWRQRASNAVLAQQQTIGADVGDYRPYARLKKRHARRDKADRWNDDLRLRLTGQRAHEAAGKVERTRARRRRQRPAAAAGGETLLEQAALRSIAQPSRIEGREQSLARAGGHAALEQRDWCGGVSSISSHRGCNSGSRLRCTARRSQAPRSKSICVTGTSTPSARICTPEAMTLPPPVVAARTDKRLLVMTVMCITRSGNAANRKSVSATPASTATPA